MRKINILHLCLLAPYNDYWGYQDNLIPKYHRAEGHNVTVITTNTWHCNGKIEKTEVADYLLSDGQRIIRLDYTHFRPRQLSAIMKIYRIYDLLCEIKPDFIMVHGLGNLSYLQIVKYLKRVKPDCRVIADNHADYYNAGGKPNWKGKVIRFIERCLNSHMQRFCEAVYGTTPWRVTFATDVLGISDKKAKLLVTGGDDEYIHLNRKDEIRAEIREKLNIEKDDFVVITGGKIDRTKNIHLLMEAVSKIDCDNLKLIVFGQPNDEMKPEIEALAKDEKIRFIGWIKAEDSYDYFLASDLVVFPGTHSVLWEQACACGVPCVFKDWEGMHHVDIGGNCEFLREDSAEEMKRVVENIAFDEEKYEKMKLESEKGIKIFSYKEIAKRVIEG